MPLRNNGAMAQGHSGTMDQGLYGVTALRLYVLRYYGLKAIRVEVQEK